MKKIKITAGIIWAVAGLVFIILLFPNLGRYSRSLAQLPFMKINPRYSGGEIAFREVLPCCTLEVRKPVFDGLMGERKRGFVQIDWRGDIPETICDTIDYDRDNNPDFTIELNTIKPLATITSLNDIVSDLEVSTQTSYGWAVRINLERK